MERRNKVTGRVGGFTLAEVLITLAIIGVVAALTIPAVVKNYQKTQTVTKLKKAWSIINQAYNNSQAENGMHQTWDIASNIGTAQYFDQYWKPHLKVAKVCSKASDCGYKSGAPWKHASGNDSTTSVVAPDTRTTFLTPDGMLFVIFSSEDDAGAANNNIFVDLNGSKGPNVYGKDLFRFVRTDKGVLPQCHSNSMNEINSNCSKAGTGTCCAAKLARDGWQIQNDYPW